MKHRIGFNRLNRKSAHRRAMLRNMATSLFLHERIRTTKAKAKELQRRAEKMITRSRVDTLHNRRILARDIHDRAVLAKLFTDIGPRYVQRPGGYTRIVKLGRRRGDAAEMVFLELVDRAVKPRKKPKAKESKEEAAAEGAE